MLAECYALRMELLTQTLARMTDTELSEIAAWTYAVPSSGAPGLLAWIEHVVDVEQHRRRGIELPESAPAAAIDEIEDLPALRAALSFQDVAFMSRRAAFFSAVAATLLQGTRH